MGVAIEKECAYIQEKILLEVSRSTSSRYKQCVEQLEHLCELVNM